MRKRYIVLAAVVVFVLLAVLAWLIRRKKKRTVNPEHFLQRWHDLQKNCASRKTWADAVIAADNLLDEALRRRGYKGKTTGERLVAAQHRLSSNSSVWFGHKLRNRIVNEDVRKLKKQEVLGALSGFREALRDLGALRRD